MTSGSLFPLILVAAALSCTPAARGTLPDPVQPSSAQVDAWDTATGSADLVHGDRTGFCFYLGGKQDRNPDALCSLVGKADCDEMQRLAQEYWSKNPAAGVYQSSECLPIVHTPLWCLSANLPKGGQRQFCMLDPDVCGDVQRFLIERGNRLVETCRVAR